MTMVAVPFDTAKPYSHVTVMREEVVRALEPRPGGVYVDLTAGVGGHSEAILDACPAARVLAFDRDPVAVAATRARLVERGERFQVNPGTFQDVEGWLVEHGIGPVDGLVADLGISSNQLDDGARGMSFRSEGPLDMRMDPESGETAKELVERLRVEDLADVIYHYGEERRSRRIARCIKQASESGELETTIDLRRAVVRAVGPRRVGGIDPATRTFQALRIAVNDELGQLEGLLAAAPRLVAPGGTAVFISFHSLEDRLVKRAFLDKSVWRRLSTKPRTASDAEQASNPRSRSAKLRAARRLDASGVLPGEEA